MTSVLLPEEERSAERIKPKTGIEKMSIDTNNTGNSRDERRSFLNHFSRENLSISHSELEQGFNKPARCFRISRHTVLSIIAIAVALVCAGIEIWKLHRVVTNGREIEILKRDVESLRHRMFGKDFMDELKAFEEQLYADGTEDEDDDSGEADIEGADYDNNYYEDYGATGWSNDMEDPREPTASATGTTTITTHRSHLPLEGAAAAVESSTSHNRTIHHHIIEAKRGQEFEENGHETHKNIARERFLDGSREHGRGNTRRTELHNEKLKDYHSKQRRAVSEEAPVKYIDNGGPAALFGVSDSNNHRHSINPTRHQIIDHSAEHSYKKTDKTSVNPITEATPWDRHPPKKYLAPTRSDNSHASSAPRHSFRRQISSFSQRQQLRRSQQDSELARKSLQPRGITRRHLRAPRQVFAAHYGADSALFGIEDEHTGNGRAKHNEGVFKAWRASDWVTDLGMTRHFTLSRDGKLTVHEPGLYLVYAQIHYLDEHDENGFHIIVNNHPILQCMVYSPGMGHKSRSCFSAQITVLQAGDRLLLKDVGPARYTLFQHDKSFFGLVKLGDSRQQQQQQQSHKQHSTPPPEAI